MTIYAYYDRTGKIRSLISLHTQDGAGMMVTPKPGLFVAEIEGLALKSKPPHFEELREIAQSHVIAIPGGAPRCTLTKKR
jgi:hypothetical protein